MATHHQREYFVHSDKLDNELHLRRDPGGQFRVPRAAAGGWESQHCPRDSFLNNHWYLHPRTEDVTGLEASRPVELSSYHHKLLIWNTYSCLPETEIHTTPRAALQGWPAGKNASIIWQHLRASGLPRIYSWLWEITHTQGATMSSSSFSTTTPSIITTFRSVKDWVFFSGSTKAWVVLTRPVLPETAFSILDVLSTPQPNRSCILYQINKYKPLGKAWVKQPEYISSVLRFYSFLNNNIQAGFALQTQQLSFPAIRGEQCITSQICLTNKSAPNKASISGSGSMWGITW